MGNTVYAFDADDPAQAEPLWSRNLGTPAPGDSWIGPAYHGILGTPFIDVPSRTLYVVALVQKDNEYNLWVNAQRHGHNPDEAVRIARVEAGGSSQAMDALRDQRGLRWLDDVARDVSFGLRTLVDQVLLRLLPVREPERLVLLDWRGNSLQSVWQHQPHVVSAMP
jgi:hypothetical protein